MFFGPIIKRRGKEGGGVFLFFFPSFFKGGKVGIVVNFCALVE